MQLKSSIFIPYKIYNEIKKYPITKGIKSFKIEELDQGVMFFDEDQKWIDPRRFEIENILPAWVLLPRFFWIENFDKLEEFTFLYNFEGENGSEFESITFYDFYKLEKENEGKYKDPDLENKIKFLEEKI